MAITFYRNQSLSNKVDKVLSDARTLNGERLVDEQFNESHPSIKVSGITDYTQYNYFKFSDKYYFMDPSEIVWETNGVAVIKGHIDVLSTFPDLVRSLVCYVERSDEGQPFIPDEMDTLLCYQNQEILEFGSGFEEDEDKGIYILTVGQPGYKTVTGSGNESV